MVSGNLQASEGFFFVTKRSGQGRYEGERGGG